MKRILSIAMIFAFAFAPFAEAWPRPPRFGGRSVNVNVQRNVNIQRNRGFNSFGGFNSGFSSFNSFSRQSFAQPSFFIEQPVFFQQAVPVFVQPQVICTQSFFAY